VYVCMSQCVSMSRCVCLYVGVCVLNPFVEIINDASLNKQSTSFE